MANPFAPAQIDFSALSGLQDRFRKGQAQRREDDLRGEFENGIPRGPNGEVDYGAAYDAFARFDPATALQGAQRHDLASQRLAQGQAMTPYQRESLGIQRDRLAQGQQLTPYQRESLDIQRGRFEADRARPRIGGTVESLRSKVAQGEQLNPGEQRVYEDALRGDPLLRAIFGDSLPSPTNEPVPQSVPGPARPPEASANVPRAPSVRSLEHLKANQNDPNVIRQFDEVFGEGAASRALGGG